jgi:hypothetical protein
MNMTAINLGGELNILKMIRLCCHDANIHVDANVFVCRMREAAEIHAINLQNTT